jgi:hypothetical protein
MFENIKFNIKYFWDNTIILQFNSIVQCITNFIKWRKVICRDRWWDYSFMLELLLFKLKDMNKYWGTSTHYQGDLDDKKILEEMIEDLEWMLNDDIDDTTDSYWKEYKKRSKRFWGRMDRHHLKFWD